MDINTLNYTIVGLDEAHMVVHINFEGHGVVSVQLPPPIPTTEQELHDAIRRFAPSVEVLEMVNSTPDLTFVKSIINQPMSTTRHSVRKEIELAQKLNAAREEAQRNEFVLSETNNTSSNMRDADKEYIRTLVREVLAEQNG